MYVETDFFLAIVKEDDWLAEAAEALYHERDEEHWTSPFTLVELLLVAYREGLDAERVRADGGTGGRRARTSGRELRREPRLHPLRRRPSRRIRHGHHRTSDDVYAEFPSTVDLTDFLDVE